MVKKVLVVLTNVDKMASDKPTGWFLPEFAHPYEILLNAGFTDIDLISPKGGICPVFQESIKIFMHDPTCQRFLKDTKAQELVNNSKTPAQVKASDYSAILFPGGHGPMYDLFKDNSISKIAAEIYENGGVIAAICHAQAALLPIKLSNGEPLVKGKTITAFSKTEEVDIDFTDDVPFVLEEELRKLGANYCKADNWQEHVVVDGRLITGQNPASSIKLGQELVKQLQ